MSSQQEKNVDNKSKCKPIRDFLCQEKLPVWATLIGIVIGALGTYFAVPYINQKLETQKIVTSFVIKNLEDNNSSIRGLLAKIGDLHHRVAETNSVDSDLRKSILSSITEMQWKAIELGVIFHNSSALLIVERYQSALEAVRKSVNDIKDKNDLRISIEAAGKLSVAAREVLIALAEIGGLRIASPTK